MLGARYLDKGGNEISYRTFFDLASHPSYHLVCKTVLESFVVNTTWLGLNQLQSPTQPPLFQTTVFRSDCSEVRTVKTSTIREATRTHELTVTQCYEDQKKM